MKLFKSGSFDGESAEDYMMHRSRMHNSRGDTTTGRSWMLTAKLMCPDSFSIQFEAYTFEKSQGRHDDAGKLLADLLQAFILNKREERVSSREKYKPLWAEVDAITDMLQSGGAASDSSCDSIFNSLPPEVGQQILLKSAEAKTNDLDKLRLFLVAFRRFPKLLNDSKARHGSDCLILLIETLRQRSMREEAVTDLQNHRELLTLLINDLLPLLLPNRNVNIDQNSIQELILLMARYVFDHALQLQMNSGTAANAATKAPSPNWNILLKNVEEIGNRLGTGWTELTDSLSRLEHKEPEVIWQKVLAVHQDRQQAVDAQGPVFYVASFLFLKYLDEYLTLSTDKPCILVEGFADHQETASHHHQLPPKRRRTTEEERRFPLVTHFSGAAAGGSDATTAPTAGGANPVVSSFVRAVKYYEFLKSFEMQWVSFMQMSYGPQCTPAVFAADFAMYHGQYREAIQMLRKIPMDKEDDDEEEDDSGGRRRCHLHTKLASLHFCMGEHPSVADQIVQAVLCFKGTTNKAGVLDAPEEALEDRRRLREIKQATPRSRHLHFLSLTKQSVISYGCKLLIHVLKDKSLQPTIADAGHADIALGHVIVLLQYGYPEERDLLGLLLHKIKMKDTFSYPIFGHYVIAIEFLEEFALLANSDANNLILDSSSAATAAANSGRRMGTRGANRGEKSEIRSMLKRQVQRCYENMDNLIAEFLTTQRDSIFQCLM